MPLYEYQCKKCGHRFEKIQLFSDRPIKKCPECGGAVEKLISRSAIQFKGSGWYVSDYAKKSSGTASSDSSTSTPAELGDSAGKAKPAEGAPAAKATGSSDGASSGSGGIKTDKPKARSDSAKKASKK